MRQCSFRRGPKYWEEVFRRDVENSPSIFAQGELFHLYRYMGWALMAKLAALFIGWTRCHLQMQVHGQAEAAPATLSFSWRHLVLE